MSTFCVKFMAIDLSEELALEIFPGVAFFVEQYIQKLGLKLSKVGIKNKT